MKKFLLAMVVACGVLGLAASSVSWGRSGPDGGEGQFAIYVAPGTIVPGAPCNWVTVHTDVTATAVTGVYAAVNGKSIDVAYTYADSLGNLVAKLRFKEVVALSGPTSATITLTLDLQAGGSISASETVRVKD